MKNNLIPAILFVVVGLVAAFLLLKENKTTTLLEQLDKTKYTKSNETSGIAGVLKGMLPALLI